LQRLWLLSQDCRRLLQLLGRLLSLGVDHLSVKRAIQERIENPLAKQILEGRFAPKETIRVDAQRGQIVFSKGYVSGGKEPLKNGGETRIPWSSSQESDCFAACVQFATLPLKG